MQHRYSIYSLVLIKFAFLLQVPMNGLFQLLDTENYANYLRALEIPTVAAKKIENLR